MVQLGVRNDNRREKRQHQQSTRQNEQQQQQQQEQQEESELQQQQQGTLLSFLTTDQDESSSSSSSNSSYCSSSSSIENKSLGGSCSKFKHEQIQTNCIETESVAATTRIMKMMNATKVTSTTTNTPISSNRTLLSRTISSPPMLLSATTTTTTQQQQQIDENKITPVRTKSSLSTAAMRNLSLLVKSSSSTNPSKKSSSQLLSDTATLDNNHNCNNRNLSRRCSGRGSTKRSLSYNSEYCNSIANFPQSDTNKCNNNEYRYNHIFRADTIDSDDNVAKSSYHDDDDDYHDGDEFNVENEQRKFRNQFYSSPIVAESSSTSTTSSILKPRHKQNHKQQIQMSTRRIVKYRKLIHSAVIVIFLAFVFGWWCGDYYSTLYGMKSQLLVEQQLQNSSSSLIILESHNYNFSRIDDTDVQNEQNDYDKQEVVPAALESLSVSSVMGHNLEEIQSQSTSSHLSNQSFNEPNPLKINTEQQKQEYYPYQQKQQQTELEYSDSFGKEALYVSDDEDDEYNILRNNFDRIRHRPRNLRLVFMGDSITRYQYLSLAYFLRYGYWYDGNRNSHGGSHNNPGGDNINNNLFNAHSYHHPLHPNEDWNEFFLQSNRILYPMEACDCVRNSNGTITVERRYFYDVTFNNVLIYINMNGNEIPKYYGRFPSTNDIFNNFQNYVGMPHGINPHITYNDMTWAYTTWGQVIMYHIDPILDPILDDNDVVNDDIEQYDNDSSSQIQSNNNSNMAEQGNITDIIDYTIYEQYMSERETTRTKTGGSRLAKAFGIVQDDEYDNVDDNIVETKYDGAEMHELTTKFETEESSAKANANNTFSLAVSTTPIVVLNAGLHPHMFGNISNTSISDELKKSFTLLWTNMTFVWKTTTFSLNEVQNIIKMNTVNEEGTVDTIENSKQHLRSVPISSIRHDSTGNEHQNGTYNNPYIRDTDIVMCQYLQRCLNISWTSSVQPELFFDNFHFAEPVYRIHNEQFLLQYKLLPINYGPLLNQSIVLQSRGGQP